MNTQEVAEKFIQLWSEDRNDEAIQELYPQVRDFNKRSFLMIRKKKGGQQMLNKSQYMLMHVEEFLNAELTHPLIVGEFFCLILKMDFVIRDIGLCSAKETWVFEVENEKIINERYFHNCAAAY